MSNYRKIITLTTYNRANYLAQTLDALGRCSGVSNYTLVVSAEPKQQDVIDVISRVNFCDVMMSVNPSILGNSLNTLVAIERGFDIANFFLIHLEDDVVFARDTLEMFEASAIKYHDNHHVFSVTAYNPEKNTPVKKDLRRMSFRQWFHPWGWGTWIDRYDAIKDHWSPKNWDIHINTKLRNGRFEIFPVISRAQNIGAVGGVHSYHYSEKWYQENHAVANFADNYPDDSPWTFDLDNRII